MTRARTRVKICGITRIGDALAADQLGVDALGFVFVPASKRYIEPSEAAVIAKQLSPFVTVVGLFLNEDPAHVKTVLSLIPDMLPQFHGQESAEYCDGFGRAYIKALGVGSSVPDEEDLARYQLSKGFLFDSNEPGALGGTGHAFDWSTLGSHMERPLILAGGLDAGNIPAAINEVAPHAVDVSSGVESAKGIKSLSAMQQFMRAVADADEKKNKIMEQVQA